MIALLLGHAVAGPVLNYQARVLDSSGDPINVPTTFVVELWTDEDLGTELWGATYNEDVQDGYVTFELDLDDENDPIEAAWFSSPVWVELTVGSTTLPRQRIYDVPGSGGSAVGQTLSHPGGSFAINLFPTSVAVIKPSGTLGAFSYNDGTTTWTGRPAATAECQATMGAGARQCSARDIELWITMGAVNAFGETDPNKLTLPDVSQSCYWISGNGIAWKHGTSANPVADYHSDCDHYTYNGGGNLGQVYCEPTSGTPWGSASWSRCNNSYPILCCR